MKKTNKTDIEDKMLTELNDFMIKFGVDEIIFGKKHSIKKDNKKAKINKNERT